MNRPALILCVALFAFAAAQLVRPDEVNPPVDPAHSLWNDTRVDPQVAALLHRACANCHSHETVWPWYAKVSPVSWLIANDVSHARHKLNFSQWKGGSKRIWGEIIDEVGKGEMPPSQYVWMHPEARLTEADKKLLVTWVDSGPGREH